jgi:hypothetical protein
MALLKRFPQRQFSLQLFSVRVAAAALIALLGAGLGAGLGGCLQADSLGDEPPDEVHVGTPPRWDNGVGALMALKCAVCHQVPRQEVSPKNTPDSFDLRYRVSSPTGLDGAAAILSEITGGILRGGSENKSAMPPAFATPLTSQERSALETWAGTGGD